MCAHWSQYYTSHTLSTWSCCLWSLWLGDKKACGWSPFFSSAFPIVIIATRASSTASIQSLLDRKHKSIPVLLHFLSFYFEITVVAQKPVEGQIILKCMDTDLSCMNSLSVDRVLVFHFNIGDNDFEGYILLVQPCPTRKHTHCIKLFV